MLLFKYRKKGAIKMKKLKTAKNKVKETYLQKEKRGLQEKLFNPEILSRPDVTGAELAMIAETSRMQIYRLFKKLGMDVKKDFKTEKIPEEIQDILWENLTCAQAERLYTWARDKRFSEKVVPEKRAYHLTKEGLKGRKENRKRTPEDVAADKAKNLEAVKNAGIPMVNPVPVASGAVAKNDTISDKLHDFITTTSSTEAQVNNLLNGLLFGNQATTEAVAVMIDKAKNDKNFNEKQWAFNTLYDRSVLEVKREFDRVVEGKQPKESLMNSKQKAQALHLYNAYWQNQSRINLAKIEK